ncbi:MAG TPA: hypothetical protein VMY37_12485 [Thermoguttaceae bacterium]|nr:hypothetical protein [Thermoguttaceae bacterium]
MRTKVALAVIIVVLVLAVVLLAGAIVRRWIRVLPYPMGEGQYQASPHGRYEAHAFDMHDEDFWGNERDYYELSVLDKSSRKPIRTVRMDPIPGEPRFRMYGEEQVITWPEDSKSVTFSFQGIEVKINLGQETPADK